MKLFAGALVLLFWVLVMTLDHQTVDAAGSDRSMDSIWIVAGSIVFDSKHLSTGNQLACSSCHQPRNYYQDGYERALGRGVVMPRNTPTLLNINRYRSFSWDGRGTSIPRQIEAPLFARMELAATDSTMAALVHDTPILDSLYREFASDSMTIRQFVISALGRFIESLATRETRFTRYRAGTGSLSSVERKGLALFRGKAQCVRCHTEPDFTDNQFHRIGLHPQKLIFETYTDSSGSGLRLGVDYGRGNIVSGMGARFQFRTPSLYNVELTAPYMHDGSIPTLSAVIDFYDRGGDAEGELMQPLGLTRAEKSALMAFLKTLTDVRYQRAS